VRALLLTVALVACSARSTETTPAPRPSLAQFVPTDATAVSAWRPTVFPVLFMLDDVNPEMLTCWRGLEDRIVAAYQVFTPPGSSFAVLEGDLPRVEVEKCVDDSLFFQKLSTSEAHHRDGELTVFETTLGAIYTAWRGRFVVVGSHDGVTHALAATASRAWSEAVAELPRTFATTSFVAIGVDRTYAVVLGVPTTRWKLTVESVVQPWPVHELVKSGADLLERFGDEQERIAAGLPPTPASSPPPPRDPAFVGRLELRYATPGDATRAGQALAKRAFGFALEDNLAAALARLPQSIDGATLAVRFDQTSFPGVELSKLQAWIARAQAASSTQ
jgi:hypothetical protein